MNDNAQELWLQSAQNLQQSLAESLGKTFESFRNMDLGVASPKLMAPTAKAPKNISTHFHTVCFSLIINKKAAKLRNRP